MHYNSFTKTCQHLFFHLQSLAIYDIMIKNIKRGHDCMASVSLTIRIDENDKKVFEKMAKENDRSINYYVNQAIKEFIKKNPPDKKD